MTKKNILIILILSFGMYLMWNILFADPYRLVNVDIANEQEIANIERTFRIRELPKGSKIEKATKLVQNGSRLFVKLRIPVEKIDEFSKEYTGEFSYGKEKAIKEVTELHIEVYQITKEKIEWWDINDNNADYRINLEGSKELIFCKPKDGIVSVYMVE